MAAHRHQRVELVEEQKTGRFLDGFIE